MTCWCGRAHKGFGLKEFDFNTYEWFCSLEHLSQWKENAMIDFTRHEETALQYAGQMAGEYINEIGKTDLKTFTKEEWVTLLKVVYGNTTMKISALEIASCKN